MKQFLALFFLCVGCVCGQTNMDLQKLVETEKAFAKTAEMKGTKAAFLEFLADDGIIFEPTATNGKESWKARPESPALLAWSPTYADISSNGALGYTTGDWSFHPKGKDDTPVAFGQYFTIWQRQADGNYKAVLDLGVTHQKPAKLETDWKSPSIASSASDTKKTTATAAAQEFFLQAETKGLADAYKLFAAEDMRLLRDGDMPFSGKKDAFERIKKDKGVIKFSKRMFFVGGGDLAYLSDTYTLTKSDKTIIKGNLAQIWRLRNGNWQIVMDVWNQLPPENKPQL